MTDEFVLHFEHARNLFDESDMIALPEPDQAQQLALTGIGRALLAIAGELRSLNSGRDQFNRTVSDFLVTLTLTLKNDEGSLRSEQPAAASGCPVCGRPFSKGMCDNNAELTREQWLAHSEDFAARLVQVGASRLDASLWSEQTAKNWYGPFPEES